MKKLAYVINLFVLGLCLSFAVPAVAQEDDREDVREERRDRDRDNLRDEDDNEARGEDDDDGNYGWIGLLGLAGLAGLLRRPDRKVAHTDSTYRSTNTGHTNLGRDTDTNRTV